MVLLTAALALSSTLRPESIIFEGRLDVRLSDLLATVPIDYQRDVCKSLNDRDVDFLRELFWNKSNKIQSVVDLEALVKC